MEFVWSLFCQLTYCLLLLPDPSSSQCSPTDRSWSQYIPSLAPVDFEGQSTLGGCSMAQIDGQISTQCFGPGSFGSSTAVLGDQNYGLPSLGNSSFVGHAWNQSVSIEFSFPQSTNVVGINLYFYNISSRGIGLPYNIRISTSGVHQFALEGNQDLSQDDNQLRNVTLRPQSLSVSNSFTLDFTFSADDLINLLLLTEVEICTSAGARGDPSDTTTGSTDAPPTTGSTGSPPTTGSTGSLPTTGSTGSLPTTPPASPEGNTAAIVAGVIVAVLVSLIVVIVIVIIVLVLLRQRGKRTDFVNCLKKQRKELENEYDYPNHFMPPPLPPPRVSNENSMTDNTLSKSTDNTHCSGTTIQNTSTPVPETQSSVELLARVNPAYNLREDISVDTNIAYGVGTVPTIEAHIRSAELNHTPKPTRPTYMQDQELLELPNVPEPNNPTFAVE